ncbi:MAG: group 1 truncated hemoglobin [Bryobacteraceae bacterium]
MQTATTLYERIGGDAALSVAVDRFYDRVLADSELASFFRGVNMQRLRGHQHAFLSQALGGPRKYSGASMAKAHARLSITQRHFDLVAAHLVGTLRELGVPEDLIGEVASAVTPLATDIVNA